jgi:hypothetical protein
MTTLFGLLFLAGTLSLWLAWRTRTANANPTQKHLARLLVVCGRAFNDRNEELYLATIREIISTIRNERWGCAEIESRVRHALSIAKAASSLENFEKASRLAQNIMQASAQSAAAIASVPRPVSRLIARTTS